MHHLRGTDSVARSSAREARQNASDAKMEARQLRADVERLLIITEALWQILREQHGFEPEDLVRRMKLIDLRDGRLDGRVAPQGARPCVHCQRPASPRALRCMYCGGELPYDPFAR